MMPPTRRTRRRGYTLLETAIVLAIMVIGGLLVMPRWNAASSVLPDASSDISGLDDTGAQLVDLLLQARRRAILHRQVVTVRLDRELTLVRIDTSGVDGTGLWSEQALPLGAGETLDTQMPVSMVEFHPSGAAISDSLPIRHSAGRSTIRIDSWSGDVRLDGAHAIR
jgi:prepilin-type N-terminal cleavage/methylation domain-containing protein